MAMWKKYKKGVKIENGFLSMTLEEKRHYINIHSWLIRHHGKANKCDNPGCPGKSKLFHWALKKGYEYERNPMNFIHLCASCHRKYDMTDEFRDKTRRRMTGQKFSKQRVENMRKGLLKRAFKNRKK